MIATGPQDLRPMPGRAFVLVDPDKEKSAGGVYYPDDAQPPSTRGTLLTDCGCIKATTRVILADGVGSSLRESAPHRTLPRDLLEIGQGDLLAYQPTETWTDNFYPPELPRDSLARAWTPVSNHVLMRPYSPAGVYTGGLVASKNENFPRIWAWLLFVPPTLAPHDYPDLLPGRMVVYSRFSDNVIGYDVRKDGFTRDLPVVVAPVEELQCVFYPAPISLANEVD